jgi:hypothetical protein
VAGTAPVHHRGNRVARSFDGFTFACAGVTDVALHPAAARPIPTREIMEACHPK